MRTAANPGARALLVAAALLLFACERGSTTESRPPAEETATTAERGDGPAAAEVTTDADEPGRAAAEQPAARDSDDADDAENAENAENAARPETRCAPRFTEELRTILGPIDGLVFAYDKAVIKPQSYAVLDHIVEVLLDNPEVRIQIDGHRDDDPHWRERAVEISRKRAESVRRYFVDKGVPADRLEARGFGPTKPLVPNDSKENRARNRRVELRAPEIADGERPCPEPSAPEYEQLAPRR